jgi:predicted enzyme involved in methoxymalonyl-ACP biosynthesis
MSCRVLKRGVEDVVFNIILETAKKWGCNWIIGEYLPTKKNKMVSGFYQDLGFKPCPDDFFSRTEEGGIVYRFKVPGSSTRQHFIKVERL